jgi:hypothetical protein
MFLYETPLIVNVSASLEATLLMVPAVNRQTFAGPFNTVGNVIAFGFLQIGVLPLAVLGVVAELALLKTFKSAKVPYKRYFNDIRASALYSSWSQSYRKEC